MGSAQGEEGFHLEDIAGDQNPGFYFGNTSQASLSADDTSAKISIKKRARAEEEYACEKEPQSKACREKARRDKINDKFAELSNALELGSTVKSDKIAILTEALRFIEQLRAEALLLKESNARLAEANHELKLEKSELREEKAVLRQERGGLEQQLKAWQSLGVYPGMAPQPHPTYKPQAVPATYPPVAWGWMPPSSLDTSRDHILRPPAA